jgi:putative ATP-binding cassette transporter
MDVVRTIVREHPDEWRRALLVAGVAGVGNAAILGLINRGASIAATDGGAIGLRLLVLFLFCMVAFYCGKRYALIQASVIVEHMVRNRLVRVADKLRRSELEIIEHLGHGDIYARLMRDTGLVSQSGLILVNAAQQSFVLLFCLVYIAWLSRAAFAATVLTIGVGTFIYMRHASALDALLKRMTMKEAELIDVVGHMVDGFKEIRLSRSKNDALFNRLVTVSAASRDLKIDAQTSFCLDIMFSDLFFYTLLAVVVFLLPRFVPTYGAVVLMTTAAILFIIGPLQMVVQAAPVFARAAGALGNLQELEDRIAVGLAPNGAAAPAPPAMPFKTITLEGACFTYGVSLGALNGASRNGQAFSIGPLNLTITRGETIFLVGGNGSGKTTTLKLMTGLYPAQRGVVKVDHDLIDRHNIQEYRERFSTVFAEFHLFDRLYGLEGVADEEIMAILESLQIADKTRVEQGRFTNLELSTGQRKRLALAICLLEDRDILVFDEWAADQDPHFRRHFYEVVLPDLKARGKTIIAATHDDRFWHLADRVIRMEYGVATDASLTH